MAKSLSNLNILDKARAIELNLTLNSFSGGENTLGSDHELKSNEARSIKNWEATSLGQMIRAKGFNQIAAGQNVIEAVVFTGSGLDDGTSGGTYTGTATSLFEVEIDGTGTPDTFKWRKDGGAYTEGVAITGSAQTLSDGVQITFAATTGHTSGDEWAITAVSYTLDVDLLIEHFEGTSTEVYTIIEGDLLKLSGGALVQDDANAFTSGTLCHAVSAGSKLWITNSTDNLVYKTIAGNITTPTDQPANARARIYEHKGRLFAEGGGTTVYGSVVGIGNWAGANGWTTSGDAWSYDAPDVTQGAVMGWPSGGDITVFTKFKPIIISNIPNVTTRPIENGYGCSAPHSIARGSEGVFFVSEYPTKGVFLWNGLEFINLTEYHDFIDNINLNQRVFGIYRNRKYYLFYNESGSGVNYPNRLRIYDTRFGRWMERPVNSGLSDNFGFPALLTKTNNELYVGSSLQDIVYELETTDNDDEGNDTQATYTTKEFTSRDLSISSGGELTIDNIRFKLIKGLMLARGVAGTLGLNFSMERGRIVVGKSFDLTAEGDRLNVDFTLNSSKLVSSDTLRSFFFTLPNKMIGRSFSVQITNNGQSSRPEIHKLKLYAIAIDEV